MLLIFLIDGKIRLVFPIESVLVSFPKCRKKSMECLPLWGLEVYSLSTTLEINWPLDQLGSGGLDPVYSISFPESLVDHDWGENPYREQYFSRLMGKPTICIGENKVADQLRGYLRGNREADQRLCFRYSDSTIPLLLKSEISRF